jgi:1,2-diacylglycerol 3-alpha-glucosyltransferase
MRVLFISDVYFPRVNGVSTSIKTFRSDLEACGIETTLIAPDYGSPIAGEDSAKIVRVASARVPRDPEDRRMKAGALREVLAGFARDSFDLVHIHTPFVAHYAGVRFARRAGIPCIATYHTFFEEYLHHYVPVLPRNIGRWLARAFTRSQCAQVAALVAPSEPMRDALRAYGIDTAIHIVPTGLPADRFNPGDGARFRAAAGLPADGPLLLYVGRVAHEKNIDFLVRTFALIRREIPAATLLIAGEGPAREALGQLAHQLQLGDSVRFVGYLDRDSSLLDCYASADAFVFASRTETQGLVLLEALAQGAPVVSTAAMGTRSILTPGCGAVVVEEDAAQFAAAVIRLLDDPDRRRKLAEEGPVYAQRWSSLAMAQRMATLYRSLHGSNAAVPQRSGQPHLATPGIGPHARDA